MIEVMMRPVRRKHDAVGAAALLDLLDEMLGILRLFQRLGREPHPVA